MSTAALPHADRVDALLSFWFGDEPDPTQETVMRWWRRSDEFDAQLRQRFGADHERALAGELSAWEDDPRACVALVILIDQLSRNLNRDHPATWANDAQALAITRRAIERGLDRDLSVHHRQFLYMPLMHAEDRGAQAECVAAFERLTEDCGSALRESFENNLFFAKRHQEIVDRFGRFPHRNAVLGRESTAEEIAFLREPNSSF